MEVTSARAETSADEGRWNWVPYLRANWGSSRLYEEQEASVLFTSKQSGYRYLREPLQCVAVLPNQRVLRAMAGLVQVPGIAPTAAEHPPLEGVFAILGVFLGLGDAGDEAG